MPTEVSDILHKSRHLTGVITTSVLLVTCARWCLTITTTTQAIKTEAQTQTRYRPLWDMTTAGRPRCSVWCRLYGTVYRRKRPGNTQNDRTVLPIANLMADSELGSPVSYLSFLVTICLSRLVSEIFTCDRQTNRWTHNADYYYSWPPHCGGSTKNENIQQVTKVIR